MRYFAILIVLFSLLLTACGAAPSPSGNAATVVPLPIQPADSTAAPAPTAAPEPTAAPAPTTVPTSASTPAGDILVVYHKSGGFAGINDILTVHADGRLELQTRQDPLLTTQIDPAQLADLQKLLASPAFAAVQSPDAPLGADQFHFELSGPSLARPIKTIEGAQNAPALDQAIAMLEQLRSQFAQTK